MHRYIQTHQLLSPSTLISVIQVWLGDAGRGWTWGNFNEILMLNHWQVTTSATISPLMHAQICTNWALGVLLCLKPCNHHCSFSLQSFLFKGCIWKPALDSHLFSSPFTKCTVVGSRQPPLTRNMFLLGCCSPLQHQRPCWHRQSREVKISLSKGSTVCSPTWLLKQSVFNVILIR